MNVTLIRPPAYSTGLMGAQLVPFLGIAYIASAARQAGHDVDIIDMCGEDLGRTEIVRKRFVAYGAPFSFLKERLKPSSVIGFTCMFSQDWVFHKELIKYVRSISPEAVLVGGGEHISAVPEYCLEDSPELDVCIVGEGEEPFCKLLSLIEKKEDFSNAPSLVFRSLKKDNYCRTKRAGRIKEVDNIALPAWDLTPMENYLSKEMNYHICRGRTVPMLASRGCPYNCAFCSNHDMWGMPWAARNASSIADEMALYIEKYKADNFVFSDLTAVVGSRNLIELCNEILRRKLNITWQLPTLRTEAVNYEVLSLMREAGCMDLDFAIESGSKKVLASVNKKNDPERIFSLVKDGLKVGMNLSTNIVIGLPKEGFRDFLSTYKLTLALAFKGLQELNVFPFVPYPGSKLFKDFVNTGRIKLNDEYFSNLFSYADLSRPVSWSSRFGARTLNFMRLFLFISFYTIMFITHPARIARLIVNCFKGKRTTKLEGVIGRVFRNVRVYAVKR